MEGKKEVVDHCNNRNRTEGGGGKTAGENCFRRGKASIKKEESASPAPETSTFAERLDKILCSKESGKSKGVGYVGEKRGGPLSPDAMIFSGGRPASVPKKTAGKKGGG